MSGGNLEPAQPVVGRAVEQPERGLRGPQAPPTDGIQAPDMPAVELGRPDFRMVLSQPAGQAPHHVLICPDGVLGAAVGPQRQLPGR
jgi:hypothetical protein